jgi:phosphate transport system substrate-binding protein
MRSLTRPLSAAAVTAALLVLAPHGGQAQDVYLRGAGATFPAPLYMSWIESFEATHPEVTIAYDAVGSGEGISRFVTGSVDFGASDAALSEEQIASVKQGVELVPATAGMIVLAYNLPGVDGELRLPREVYAGILSGEITAWDDPLIQAANPDLELPNWTIVLVARLDGSGTTYALSNHLNAVSETWREEDLGVGTLIDWPGGAMLARGNDGVAGRVKISQGSIGYMEYGFASRLGLPMAALENAAGAFVAPSAESGQMALAAPPDDDLQGYIVDPAGPGAYPIVTYSWLMLYQSYDDPAKQAALREFVRYGLTDGQTAARELGYVPLAEDVVERSLAHLDNAS